MDSVDIIQNEQGQVVGEILECERGYRPMRLPSRDYGPQFPFRSSAVEWLGGVE